MRNLWGHLRTVARHRRLVRQGCFRLGLYRQGLTHDLSKYSPTELLPSVRFFQGGKRSPISAERKALGASRAWMHHKGRNKHHFEYWYDYDPVHPTAPMVPVEMPPRYLLEMAVDRMCAAKVYLGDAYTDAYPLYYLSEKPGKGLMHPNTFAVLETLYAILKEQGEDAMYDYARALLKRRKGSAEI